MAPPVISLIVPVYDVARYVGACIDSIARQTFRDFEVIVVDDGSTDGSDQIVRDACIGDERFQVIWQANGGLSSARNAGLSLAKGSVIGFVDSDDRLHPEYLECLYGALEETGTKIAACAVEITKPSDATRHDDSKKPIYVSAIHGQAFANQAEDTAVYPLEDWSEIIRFWPSAWNKLYRAELIGDLRFIEGTYYEDHPWFQALAAQTEKMAYVGKPLYLHTQGREGQITRDDSERLFEQFDVLDACHEIMSASGKSGAEAGFAKLASRLLFERSNAAREPIRRAAFARQARRYLDDHDIDYVPDWDSTIARSWDLVMDGALPLSVVIATDASDPEDLAPTLRSLKSQSLQDFETLIVQVDPRPQCHNALLSAASLLPGSSVLAALGGGGLTEARQRGLDLARGDYVMFLDAGDILNSDTLWMWVEGMLRSKADLGLGQLRIGIGSERVHSGCHDGRDPWGDAIDLEARADWQHVPHGTRLAELLDTPARPVTPERALRLHAHPSAKIYRRSFLQNEGIVPEPEPLSSWQMTLAAALAADGVTYLAWPGVQIATAPGARRLWREPTAPADLAIRLEEMSPILDAVLPREEWYPTLLARALWEKLNFAAFTGPAQSAAFVRDAKEMLAGRFDPDAQSGFDPYIGPRIRDLFAPSLPEDETHPSSH